MKSRPLLRWLTAVLACATNTPDGYADLIAIEFGRNFAVENRIIGVLGWEFTTNSEITVTRLGWYDFGSDGNRTAHEVGIFDAGQNLLVTGTVNAGAVDPLEGPPGNSFRYVAVPQTTLPAGQTFVIAGLNPPSPLLNDGVGYALGAAPFSSDPAISFVQGRRLDDVANLVFPPDVDPQGGVT